MKLRMISVVLVLLFLLGANVQAAEGNSYWQRMGEGFPNPVVVYAYRHEYKAPELELVIRVPQLMGAFDVAWKDALNQALRDRLEAYVDGMKAVATEAWEFYNDEYRPYPYEGIVDFEVKLNQGGLLSIAIVNYSFTGGAHGMTIHDYINLDLTTGKTIAFRQLFDTDAELERVAEVINQRVAQEPQGFFIDVFTLDRFSEDQGFYLQDTQAVVCFGLYDLAPYASGIQEFIIAAP